MVHLRGRGAVLRYRLYDIDRLINRTLVYAVLTALLGLASVAGVFVLGDLVGLRNARSPFPVAATTLGVAALFQPARRRVRAAVDRRFNRRRYDAARTVDAFSARPRDQLDPDTLTAELLATVHSTVQSTRASFWRSPSFRALRMAALRRYITATWTVIMPSWSAPRSP